MKFLWVDLSSIGFPTTKKIDMKVKLSIIIVNYNVTNLLRNCIVSIQKYTSDIAFEIIVIDNNSTDSTWKSLIDEFPEVTFIASEVNEGFAKANNKAIKEAKGKYVLLLNPDTEFEDYYILDIIKFVDSKPNFGCLGVRMHDAEGNFLPESKRSVPDMYNSFGKLFGKISKENSRSYYRNDIPEDAIAEVEVVTGAFLLVKREVYNNIGGLDEAYFMYGEDIDICYTLLNKGLTNYYYGKASLLHYKGESTVRDRKYLERFYGAMQIFLDKYYKENIFQYWLLLAGLKLRYTIERTRIK